MNVENDEEVDGRYIVRERAHSCFNRALMLADVVEDKISAKMDDGVLENIPVLDFFQFPHCIALKFHLFYLLRFGRMFTCLLDFNKKNSPWKRMTATL